MTITPRSLFNIILKIFGLFFLREIITEIPVAISVFIRYFSASGFETTVGMLIASLIILCFYVFLALQLLFRTNAIIDVLGLEKGFFEHEFSFEERKEHKISLTTTEVLLISLIVIGGYILVNIIPDFCKQVYLFVDMKKSVYVSTAPSVANILASGAKILLALLILGERNSIVDFIEGKKKEESDDNP